MGFGYPGSISAKLSTSFLVRPCVLVAERCLINLSRDM